MFRLNTRFQAPSSLHCTGCPSYPLDCHQIKMGFSAVSDVVICRYCNQTLCVGTTTQAHHRILPMVLVLPPIDDEDGVHRTSIYPTGSLLLVGIFKMLWFCCGHSNLKNISITFQATTIIIIGPVTSHSTLHFTLNNLEILDTHDNSRASSPITTHSVTT